MTSSVTTRRGASYLKGNLQAWYWCLVRLLIVSPHPTSVNELFSLCWAFAPHPRVGQYSDISLTMKYPGWDIFTCCLAKQPVSFTDDLRINETIGLTQVSQEMHTYLSQDMPVVYLYEEQVASTGNRICTKQIFPRTNERKLIGETGYRVCRLPNQWESWPLTTGAVKIHNVEIHQIHHPTCIFTSHIYLAR